MKKSFLLSAILIISLLSPTLCTAKKPDWVKAVKQGNKCMHSEDYNCAIRAYSKALKILPRQKNTRPQFQCYSGLGNAYKAQARYDVARENYLNALKVAEKSGSEEAAGITLMRLAEISGKWGDHKDVRKYLKAAQKKLANSTNLKILSALNTSLGMSYMQGRDYENAEKHMLKAIDFAASGPSIKIRAKIWNRLGNLYLRMNELDKAENAFRSGLKINEDLGNDSIVAQNLNDIAKINIERNELAKAEEQAGNALVINKKLGRKRNMSEDLHLLGVIEYEKGNNRSAIEYLNQAVEIKNSLRETAQGRARRTYLASQINSYNRLIDAYSAEKDAEGFFSTFEMSRSRQLAETLGTSDKDSQLSLKYFQRIIPEETAVLLYSVTGKNRLRLLGISNTRTVVKRLHFDEFAVAVNRSHPILTAELSGAETEERGLKSARKSKDVPLPPISNIMEAVTRYRLLLADPADKYEKDRITLSRELRSMLISCIPEITGGKKNLTVIPDGPLALIPFETLLSESNRYLVQDFEVGYVQSAAILKHLQERRRQGDNLSIIAFGGAEYEKGITANQNSERTVCETEELEDNIGKAFKNRKSLSFAYSCLDLNEFPNLPGTSAEIQKIGEIFKNAELITGGKVNEKRIRQMSRQGKLQKAGIIHFAVHGIAVPTYPELSALVLSRTGNDDSTEGFLNAAEIRRLNIGARFVNLSACETGLGALVRGEGIVGLTHAFLSAGAGAMSVSLWNVSDKSAVEFMADMYTGVMEGNDFRQSMAATKNSFINGRFGKRYIKPYYWAPFVYYGQ